MVNREFIKFFKVSPNKLLSLASIVKKLKHKKINEINVLKTRKNEMKDSH